MNGHFRLINLEDISRDDHLEFYLSQTRIKDNLSVNIFMRFVVLNHHNNVQKHSLKLQKVPNMMMSSDMTSYL